MNPKEVIRNNIIRTIYRILTDKSKDGIGSLRSYNADKTTLAICKENVFYIFMEADETITIKYCTEIHTDPIINRWDRTFTEGEILHKLIPVIQVLPQGKVLFTEFNMHDDDLPLSYNKLPSTEEQYFMEEVKEPAIIGLDECFMLNTIIEIIKQNYNAVRNDNYVMYFDFCLMNKQK